MILNCVNNNLSSNMFFYGHIDNFYFEFKYDSLSNDDKIIIDNLITFLVKTQTTILKNINDSIEINIEITDEVIQTYNELDFNDLTNDEKITINDFIKIIELNKTNKL